MQRNIMRKQPSIIMKLPSITKAVTMKKRGTTLIWLTLIMHTQNITITKPQRPTPNITAD